MSAPGPTRLRNAEQSAIADRKIAAALDRMRQAGTPITKSGLAREAGVNVKAVALRWEALIARYSPPAAEPLPPGVVDLRPQEAPARRRFARKPPPPRQPPPMEKARLAGLLTAACDPTSTDADVLIAARAAGRLLARIGMSVDAVLLHQQAYSVAAVGALRAAMASRCWWRASGRKGRAWTPSRRRAGRRA